MARKLYDMSEQLHNPLLYAPILCMIMDAIANLWCLPQTTAFDADAGEAGHRFRSESEQRTEIVPNALGAQRRSLLDSASSSEIAIENELSDLAPQFHNTAPGSLKQTSFIIH